MKYTIKAQDENGAEVLLRLTPSPKKKRQSELCRAETFEEVPVGALFMRGGQRYMKTKEVFTDKGVARTVCNAVCEDGTISGFGAKVLLDASGLNESQKPTANTFGELPIGASFVLGARLYHKTEIEQINPVGLPSMFLNAKSEDGSKYHVPDDTPIISWGAASCVAQDTPNNTGYLAN